MRILYVGESWLGSCARSLKEALRRRADVVLDEVGEDLWFPHPRARWLRLVNRVTAPAYRREFAAHVLGRVRDFRPDVLIAHKGTPIRAELIDAVRALGVFTANVYPDYSPHAYGDAHARAVGSYDLVISTKSYHPGLWQKTYGYANPCVFVPQGYDPALHLADAPPAAPRFDVVLVATWRPEYGRLMQDLAAALGDEPVRVAIGGHGWEEQRATLPSSWEILGAPLGQAYVQTLRLGRICVAPLTRDVRIQGRQQPGDVDTTRTYELAAAHCFFVHRRTDYVRQVYDERREVPMFDDATELAAHIRHYLGHEGERLEMAAAAHRRAVPAYSLDARVAEIVASVDERLATRRRGA